MKSQATTAGERISGRLRRQEQEASYVNGMYTPNGFEDHEPAYQMPQGQHAYISSRLPSYFAFDTHLQDHLGPPISVEWPTVHDTTVCSSTLIRDQPFSIYGTSSDNYVAEDLTYEPALPSPISSLGSHDILTPFNSSRMIWERLPASDGTDLINTTSPLRSTSQEHYQDLGDEIDLLEENGLPAKSELGPVLPMNSRSSSLSTTEDITESPARSECITLEESEMPPAKRRRTSAPSPRWSTSRRTRKKKLEQTTIIFPQSPSSSIPKTNHNAIEKQYRNRLNDKFEALLSVLPAQETESGSLAKVSKGDVLILAKDYIESLERSRDEMREDQRLLQEDVKGMKEAWLQSNGTVLP